MATGPKLGRVPRIYNENVSFCGFSFPLIMPLLPFLADPNHTSWANGANIFPCMKTKHYRQYANLYRTSRNSWLLMMVQYIPHDGRNVSITRVSAKGENMVRWEGNLCHTFNLKHHFGHLSIYTETVHHILCIWLWLRDENGSEKDRKSVV